MLDTLTPACMRLIGKVIAGLADDSDPLNRPHAARCAVLGTPIQNLTEETCDCAGGELS